MSQAKKTVKQFHSSSKATGMGDAYGSGKRNATSKPVSLMGVSYTNKKRTLGKPPKTMA